MSYTLLMRKTVWFLFVSMFAEFSGAQSNETSMALGQFAVKSSNESNLTDWQNPDQPVRSPESELQSVLIYDLYGRPIYENSEINLEEIKIPKTVLEKQIVIFSVLNGLRQISGKKFIINS